MVEEYISKNYTLEKHLKSLSETDKEYELSCEKIELSYECPASFGENGKGTFGKESLLYLLGEKPDITEDKIVIQKMSAFFAKV